MSVFPCVGECNICVCEGQNRALNPLELKLQARFGCLAWYVMLGCTLWSSRLHTSISCSAISVVPQKPCGQLWALSTPTNCNDHLFSVLKYFIIKRKLFAHWTVFFPAFSTLPNTNVFSFSMDFPFLNISYKWNHTAGGLLYLSNYVLNVYPCSIYQDFTSFRSK